MDTAQQDEQGCNIWDHCYCRCSKRRSVSSRQQSAFSSLELERILYDLREAYVAWCGWCFVCVFEAQTVNDVVGIDDMIYALFYSTKWADLFRNDVLAYLFYNLAMIQ